MRALGRPYARYQQDLSSVMTTAERATYPTDIDRSCEQARQYARRSPRLHTLTAATFTSPAASDFFRGLYDANRNAVRDIKLRVWNAIGVHGRARCPYCGIPCRHNALDHYLERSTFPELSLYARNLIPCCGSCNSIKRTFSPAGERQVLHHYDDEIDSLPELIVVTFTQTTPGRPVAEFAVARSSNPQHELFRRHFYALQLDAAYREQASSLLQDYRGRAVREQLNAGSLINVLRAEVTNLRAEHGPNQYEASLYDAASRDMQLLQWMMTP
jgi:hypothetical protein